MPLLSTINLLTQLIALVILSEVFLYTNNEMYYTMKQKLCLRSGHLSP